MNNLKTIDIFLNISSDLNELQKEIEYFFLKANNELIQNGFFYKLILNQESNINTDIVFNIIGENFEEIEINSKFKYYFFANKKIDISKIDERHLKIIELKEEFEKSDKITNMFNSIEELIEKLNVILDEIKPRILKIKINENNSIKSTFIDNIFIKNYFSIKNIKLNNLQERKEVYVVGENGDGKTILLQSILIALIGEKKIRGKIGEYIESTIENMNLNISDRDINFGYPEFKEKRVKNIFAYGINRNKTHYKDFDKSGFSGLFDTSDPRDTTYLKDPILVLKQENSFINKFIKELNEKILINELKIEKRENEIYFVEKGYEIDFEKLSEGYKTTIIWLSDLVSRLIENYKEDENIKELSDFKAIVLIDEVDLYLHPKWKYDFMCHIRKVFPNIQFIVTTHSLVTVFGASEDAVFYKIYKDENGDTQISEQIDDISNYTADILMSSPLFNVKTIKARNFKDKVSSDDYIYDKIHKKIKEKLNKVNFVSDEEVDNWLDEEFKNEFGE